LVSFQPKPNTFNEEVFKVWFSSLHCRGNVSLCMGSTVVTMRKHSDYWWSLTRSLKYGLSCW